MATLAVVDAFSAVPSLADRMPGAAPPNTTVIDDQDAGWTWSGMAEVDDTQFHGGTAHAGGAGTYGAYTFHGTGVKVIGLGGRSVTLGGHRRTLGNVNVSIDGKPVAWQPAAGAQTNGMVTLFETTGLSDGNHVLSIAADGGWIVVDDIEVSEIISAAGDHGTEEGKLYRIAPRSVPDKFLEIAGTTYADGSRTEIHSALPGRRQIWRFVALGNSRFRISPAEAPDEALTMTNDKDTNDKSAGLYAWSGAIAQQWLVTPTDSGYCRISSAIDNTLSLNVQYQGTTDGTFVIVYGWQGGGATNEQWLCLPAGK
jgi:uncharacterized Zn-binding protein involved in type VI secretion